MTASSGFKKYCDYCNTPDHKKPIVSNFCVSLVGGHRLRAVREETFGAVCITRTFTTTITTAPNNNSVATAGEATTPTATTVAIATNAVTAVVLIRATRQPQPTVRFRLLSPPLPRLSYCPGCSSYVSSFPGYFLGCCGQRHYVTSIGHRLLVPRRLRYSGPADVHHDFRQQGSVRFRRQQSHR